MPKCLTYQFFIKSVLFLNGREEGEKKKDDFVEEPKNKASNIYSKWGG